MIVGINSVTIDILNDLHLNFYFKTDLTTLYIPLKILVQPFSVSEIKVA